MRTRVPLFALLLLFGSAAHPTTGGEVAVIVNAANATQEISFRDLEKIFRQDKQFWSDGKKIYLVMLETGSQEKDVVLQRLYRMNEAELKKFWLQKMFKGEIATFPKTLSSAGSITQFVAKVPNAIGFVDASVADSSVRTDSSVRVLKIDGKLPGAAGYPLGTK